MTNAPISEDAIVKQINNYKKAIVSLEKVLLELKNLKCYEVGIRKSDNAVVHLSFTLGSRGYMMGDDSFIEVNVHVLPPSGQIPYRITVQEFKDNFVEYSAKARVILPSRD